MTDSIQNDDDQPLSEDRTTSFGPAAEPTSRMVGPYKLLQQIGEGGMGTVWMADQLHPLRRRVAVKLIKIGNNSKEFIARFEAERQALAMMDHPNIAKVLDAGVMDGGQPYFVMELVYGIPLNEYCDQHRMTLNERLRLFVPVCLAIQHAHQKGIIHRDIKPSNILVTIHDDEPIPKVIDFGLAKALQHQTQLTDKTLFTEFGQVVGTLRYMSPEQAELNALNVDTRTDIYSLGVVLYELLTGSTPVEEATAKNQALLTLLQIIREREPLRPSDRLSRSGDAIAGISEQRKIDPQKLRRILRGELDWIVMKALEKDRRRRYDAAGGLADDVRRYLDGDPVLARPPNTVYRMRKYIAKHRAAFFSMCAILASLAVGITGTLIQAIRARQAETLLQNFVALKPSAPIEEKRTIYTQMGANSRFIPGLLESYLSGPTDNIRVIANALHPTRNVVLPTLWKELHEANTSADRRFRAGMALVDFSPFSPDWSEPDYAFLTDHVLSESATQEPSWIGDWIAHMNLNTVSEGYRKRSGNANAIIGLINRWHAIASTTPVAEMPSESRLVLGQQRAIAAIILIRLGQFEKALSALQITDDPEPLSHFAQGCRPRDVELTELLESLKIIDMMNPSELSSPNNDASPPADRRLAGSDSPAERQIRDRMRYGVLLAIGEYPLVDLPEQQRREFERLITDLFTRADQSALIHGVTGWLLRHWGMTNIVDKIERKEEKIDRGRDWFRLVIPLTPKASASTASESASDDFTSMTFIVFPPGDYLVGAPEDETLYPREARTTVHIERPFAVLDRELTVRELNACGVVPNSPSNPSHSAVGANWYDAVKVCRWFTQQRDRSEEDQAYEDPTSLDRTKYPASTEPLAGDAPENWPIRLDRVGFRLPLEAEWEIACRAGARTAYCFGGDTGLLKDYAWCRDNDDDLPGTHPPKVLRPNLRGLFDMHGNVWEWCHDIYNEETVSTALASMQDPRFRIALRVADPRPIGRNSAVPHTAAVWTPEAEAQILASASPSR